MRVKLLIGASLLSVASLQGARAATVLAPATYDSSVSYNNGSDPQAPGYVQGGDEIFTPGSALVPNSGSSSIEGDPNPTLVSQAGGSGYNVTSESTLNYNFSIDGPDAGNIPVDLSYSGSGSASDGESYAYVVLGSVLDDSGGGTVWVNDPDNGLAQGFSGVVASQVNANTDIDITLSTFADVGASGGSASVTLDPILTIDPSFALIDPNYLEDYSIQLDDGIGNSPSPGPLPEPATWAMVMLGVGMTGAGLRMARRKNELAPAAA